MRRVGWGLAGVLLLAGCGGTTAASTSPSTSTTATSPAPSTTDSGAPTYALGSAATTRTPPPDCPLAVANWTAATGQVVVTVSADPGTLVGVTITGQASDSYTIAPGQTVHDFEFPKVRASAVTRVVVTADGGAGEVPGSCVATGSPTA